MAAGRTVPVATAPFLFAALLWWGLMLFSAHVVAGWTGLRGR